jgi:uncharacterized membrane protein
MKFLLMVLCFLPSFTFAHKGHPEALSVTAKAGADLALQTAGKAADSAADAAKTAQKIDWNAVGKGSWTTHLHNKAVHFPIALGIVGILFLALSLKYEGLRPGARWLLFLATLASAVAIFTGGRQEDDVESPVMKQVLEVHEAVGWGVTIGLTIAWLLSLLKSFPKWVWLFFVALALVIAGEGNLGGILAHMQL